jgi:hypothetical protein
VSLAHWFVSSKHEVTCVSLQVLVFVQQPADWYHTTHTTEHCRKQRNLLRQCGLGERERLSKRRLHRLTIFVVIMLVFSQCDANYFHVRVCDPNNVAKLLRHRLTICWWPSAQPRTSVDHYDSRFSHNRRGLLAFSDPVLLVQARVLQGKQASLFVLGVTITRAGNGKVGSSLAWVGNVLFLVTAGTLNPLGFQHPCCNNHLRTKRHLIIIACFPMWQDDTTTGRKQREASGWSPKPSPSIPDILQGFVRSESDVQLQEVIGRGSYGIVHRGVLGTRDICVKVDSGCGAVWW